MLIYQGYQEIPAQQWIGMLMFNEQSDLPCNAAPGNSLAFPLSQMHWSWSCEKRITLWYIL